MKIQKGEVEVCFLFSFFNFGASCGGCQRHFPVALPGTNGTGGWVGPTAGLDEWETSPTSGLDLQTVYPIA
jgi:hypothetical protein